MGLVRVGVGGGEVEVARVARMCVASRLEIPRPVCCQNCLAMLNLFPGKRTRKTQRVSEMQCCTTRAEMSRAARNERHASAALRDGKSRDLSDCVPNFCSRMEESCVRRA